MLAHDLTFNEILMDDSGIIYLYLVTMSNLNISCKHIFITSCLKTLPAVQTKLF